MAAARFGLRSGNHDALLELGLFHLRDVAWLNPEIEAVYQRLCEDSLSRT